MQSLVMAFLTFPAAILGHSSATWFFSVPRRPGAYRSVRCCPEGVGSAPPWWQLRSVGRRMAAVKLVGMESDSFLSSMIFVVRCIV